MSKDERERGKVLIKVQENRYCKSQKPVTPKWEEIGDDRVHL